MSPIIGGRIVLLVAWLAWPGATWAQALSVAALQRLLQEAPKQEVRFTESRESPWLSAPVQSSGAACRFLFGAVCRFSPRRD